MSTGPSERKPRADVIRNRARILDVAEQRFLRHGVNTSLEAVAKEARVGPATLYRHFPDREALLAGLLDTRRDDLLEQQRLIDEADSAADALREWLRALETYLSLYRGLSEPLVVASEAHRTAHPLARSCEDLIAVTDRYLQAAQRSGSARDDVDGHDLFLAVSAVAWAHSTGAVDEAALSRFRSIVATGYQCGPATI